MKRTSAKTNIKIGTILTFVFILISILSNILFTPFLLKTVGDSQYGIRTFANSITSWISMLSFGLGGSFVRFCTIQKQKEGEKGVSTINGLYLFLFSFVAVIALAVGILIIVLLANNIIPLDLYSDSEKRLLYLCFSLSLIYVVLGFPMTTFTLIETYNNRFIVIRLLQILSALFLPLLSLPFLINGFDIWIVLGVNLFLQVCFFIFDFIFCHFCLKAKFKFTISSESKKLLKDIFIFCFFILINTVVDTVNSNLDVTILGFSAGSEIVTMYQIGFTFFTYANYMSTSIAALYSPKINDAAINHTIADVNSIFLHVSKIQTFFILLSIFGFLLVGKDFITKWVGENHEQSFYVALILLISSSVVLSQTSTIEIQRAYNKHKFRSIFYLSIAALNLLGSTIAAITLPKDMIIFGCAFITGAVNIVGGTIGMNIYYKKKLNLDVFSFMKMFVKTLLIASLSFGISYFIFKIIDLSATSWITIIAKAILLIVVYLFLYVLFNYKEIKSYLLRYSGTNKILILSQKFINKNADSLNEKNIFYEVNVAFLMISIFLVMSCIISSTLYFLYFIPFFIIEAAIVIILIVKNRPAISEKMHLISTLLFVALACIITSLNYYTTWFSNFFDIEYFWIEMLIIAIINILFNVILRKVINRVK